MQVKDQQRADSLIQISNDKFDGDYPRPEQFFYQGVGSDEAGFWRDVLTFIRRRNPQNE
jgi:hypothetical protein